MLYYELGKVCFYIDKTAALTYIKKALTLDNKAAYFHLKGVLLVHSPKYKAALQALRRALSLSPGNSLRKDIYLSLGQVMTLAGYYERGYWFYMRYLSEVSPDDSFYLPVYLYIADNRYHSGFMNVGDTYIEHYVRAIPNSSLLSFMERLVNDSPDIVPFGKKSTILEKLKQAQCHDEKRENWLMAVSR